MSIYVLILFFLYLGETAVATAAVMQVTVVLGTPQDLADEAGH